MQLSGLAGKPWTAPVTGPESARETVKNQQVGPKPAPSVVKSQDKSTAVSDGLRGYNSRRFPSPAYY